MPETKARKKPWWIVGGTEPCSCCGEMHAYGTTLRCEACDAPLCPCCSTAKRGEPVLCETCKREEEQR